MGRLVFGAGFKILQEIGAGFGVLLSMGSISVQLSTQLCSMFSFGTGWKAKLLRKRRVISS